MFTSLAIVATCLGFLHYGEALECYKCAVFGKDDPDECLYIDGKTKVVECSDSEKYCIAIGHNYVNEDGKTKYTNIRRCDEDNSICVAAFFQYGDKLRNCQTCITDKCNIEPLEALNQQTTPKADQPEEEDGESPDGDAPGEGSS